MSALPASVGILPVQEYFCHQVSFCGATIKYTWKSKNTVKTASRIEERKERLMKWEEGEKRQDEDDVLTGAAGNPVGESVTSKQWFRGRNVLPWSIWLILLMMCLIAYYI